MAVMNLSIEILSSPISPNATGHYRTYWACCPARKLPLSFFAFQQLWPIAMRDEATFWRNSYAKLYLKFLLGGPSLSVDLFRLGIALPAFSPGLPWQFLAKAAQELIPDTAPRLHKFHGGNWTAGPRLFQYCFLFMFHKTCFQP